MSAKASSQSDIYLSLYFLKLLIRLTSYALKFEWHMNALVEASG